MPIVAAINVPTWREIIDVYEYNDSKYGSDSDDIWYIDEEDNDFQSQNNYAYDEEYNND